MSLPIRRGIPAIALLALALVATGCGTREKAPTSPAAGQLTRSEADDVAAQAPLALNQLGIDLAGWSSGLGTSLTQRPGANPLGATCDTTTTTGGLSFWFSRTFYDAEDAPLEGYGPGAVRMNWKSHIWGTLRTQRDTASIQHHSDLDLTGIQPADTVLAVDGDCADTLLNRFRSRDSLQTGFCWWRSTLAVADVRMPRTGGPPTSGTLTLHVLLDALRSTSTGDVLKRLDATVVVTFNGTGYPDVVVNGVYRYRWDLEQGTLVAV